MGSDVSFELSKVVLGSSRFAFVKSPGAAFAFSLVGDPIELGPVSLSDPERLVGILTKEVTARVLQVPAVAAHIRALEERLEDAEAKIGLLEERAANLRRYKLMWYADMCKAAGMYPEYAEGVIEEAMAKEGGS